MVSLYYDETKNACCKRREHELFPLHAECGELSCISIVHEGEEKHSDGGAGYYQKHIFSHDWWRKLGPKVHHKVNLQILAVTENRAALSRWLSRHDRSKSPS